MSVSSKLRMLRRRWDRGRRHGGERVGAGVSGEQIDPLVPLVPLQPPRFIEELTACSVQQRYSCDVLYCAGTERDIMELHIKKESSQAGGGRQNTGVTMAIRSLQERAPRPAAQVEIGESSAEASTSFLSSSINARELALLSTRRNLQTSVKHHKSRNYLFKFSSNVQEVIGVISKRFSKSNSAASCALVTPFTSA